MQTTSPHEGQVLRSPSGVPALYVRTEKRTSNADPEHLLIEARDRTVFTRWVDQLPEELDLVLDEKATERAEAAARDARLARAERQAMEEALKAAVRLVPVEVANDLRATYKAAVGRIMGSAA